MLPSAISAVEPKVSDKVGYGRIVIPISAAFAPISEANTALAINSPALVIIIPS
jgi:hypothetical protein